MRVALSVALAAALLAGCGGDERRARPEAPTQVSRANQIVFVSQRPGGRPGVYALEGERFSATPLARGLSEPGVSPDGARIAAVAGGRLVVLDGLGRLQRQLGVGREPAWSPDGRTLAFVREGAIRVVDVQTGAERRLSPPVSSPARPSGRAEGDSAPAWSPDGRTLAFTSGGDVWVMRAADGRNRRRIAGAGAGRPGTERHPAWHPDGLLVAYSTDADGQREIYAVPPGRRSRPPKPLRLTFSPSEDVAPAFSPDGSRLAYGSNRDGNWEVYAADVDGDRPVRLTNAPGYDGAPDWGGS